MAQFVVRLPLVFPPGAKGAPIHSSPLQRRQSAGLLMYDILDCPLIESRYASNDIPSKPSISEGLNLWPEGRSGARA
ncbi:hypothetical protein BD309DRAFT_588643 [Dichomitus squalens]|nr:hypothetical protein BD309DRAFT_588643 [Dichomitus squalens]